MNDFDVETCDGVRREVLEVERHQYLRATADSGCEHVPVLLVVRHRRHQIVVPGDHRVGEVARHSADSLLHQGLLLAVLDQVALEFDHHIRGPQRPEQATVRELKDEVVEQRSIEDVGVEEGGERHSASNSARRFTSSG